MPGGRGRYDATAFDLFGTLVDTFTVAEHERVLSEVAAALAAPRDEFTLRWVETFDARASGVFATIADNIESICRDLHLDPPEEAVVEAVRIRLDFTRRCLAPRADRCPPGWHGGVGGADRLAPERSAGAASRVLTDAATSSGAHPSHAAVTFGDTQRAPVA